MVDYGLEINVQGVRDSLRMTLEFASEDVADQRSEKIDLSSAKPSKESGFNPPAAGSKFEIEISLPATLQPGVILLTKKSDEEKSQESPPFVTTICLEAKGGKAVTEYTSYSYIDISQGERVVFPATIAYPAFKDSTPAGLQQFRDSELAAFRGTENDKKTERKGAERVYDYALYNDLGDPSDSTKMRPVLGGTVLGYPRRLRTGRAMKGNDEISTTNGDLPWLPFDERFNDEKNSAFDENVANVAGKVVTSIVGTPRGLSFALNLVPFIHQMHQNNVNPDVPQTIFNNLNVIDAMYDNLIDNGKDKGNNVMKDLLPVTRLETIQVLDLLQNNWSKMDRGLKKALGLLVPADHIDAVINEKKAKLGAKGEAVPADDEGAVGKLSLGQKVDSAVGLVHGLLEKWPIPDVRDGKAIQWRTDEEFGRMVLAGQNPFVIRALTADDLAAFAVRDSDTATFLEGRTLKQGIAEGRLWVLDHHTDYLGYVKQVAALKDNSVLYAGRCIFYTRNSGVTVPVSIELETVDQPLRVYTPNLSAEVWLLAKLVIASLDSGVHQLISHWMRTHACVEPYIIATRRELSSLNPVFKLLEPHFRYTMRINANARKVLINGGGIVEQSFTPGRYCMALSASAYGSWRFDEQGVPHDLQKRGVAAKNGPDGKLESRIPNYPYADDALQIWDAIYAFAGDYLRLYYDDDSKKVTDDIEVVAWWEAIKKEGHPDTTEGWPELKSVESLQDILATIMWVSSGHHAAVNFGQYLNSAYMPYMPSKIHRKIPDAGSDGEKELQQRFEKNLLETLTDPVATLFVMVTTKILSAHASDEEYLDKDVHNYIKDPEAVKVHTKFVEALKNAEKHMEERNKDPSKNIYSLLMPSKPQEDYNLGKDSKPAGRGVPFSISI